MTTPKISNRKREVVERLKRELLKYPIIGLVKIDNIGARVVQKMRSELRKDAKIVMAKNTLMKIAVNEVKDKIKVSYKLRVKFIQKPDYVSRKISNVISSVVLKSRYVEEIFHVKRTIKLFLTEPGVLLIILNM